MKTLKAVEELLQKTQAQELDNKKLILAGLIMAILLYTDYSFVLSRQFAGMKSSASKITKLKQDIASLTSGEAALKKAKEGPDKSQYKNKVIISESQIASLVERIAGMANKDNVKIMQIKPGKESKAKDSALSALGINIDLVCSYHSLGVFINDIENADEFMMVEGLRIEPDAVNYLQQRVNLVIKTYVKK